jgi:hypothetical protein
LQAPVRRVRLRRLTALVVGALGLTASVAAAQLPQPETRQASIAFAADGGIHAIAADGSERRRLTERGEYTVDQEPAWSPDGSSVAFSRVDIDNNTQGVWLVDRNGGGLRRLTEEGPIAPSQSGPAWSPDGAWIAFATYRHLEEGDSVTSSIVAVRPDGGDRRTIHRETSRDIVVFEAPAWSPDGGRILFTRSGLFTDEPDSLHSVPAAGGAARRIAANGSAAAWAPSGDRIAYAARHSRASGRLCSAFCVGSGEIYVANADGSGRVRLTNSRADDRNPSWSGDGLRIAFQSDRNSTQARSEQSPPELYSIRPDGSCLTWLTNGTAHSESPDFERDGALSSDPGGCGAVPREPLVETGMPKEFRWRFRPWWLGSVAPNGLLLTGVGSDPHVLSFDYHDCGRFDPDECGDFVNVENRDVCATGALRRAGRPGTRLGLARGALLEETRDERDQLGRTILFSHRTRVLMDAAGGWVVDRGLIGGLRRYPSEDPDPGAMPSARLPSRVWRGLRPSRRVSDREAKRRRAVARRLAQLGVKRRLSC